MKQVLLLIVSFVSLSNALELEFGDWKKFIDEEREGYRKTAYQGNQENGEFQMTYVVHVNQKRNEYSYVQGIVVGLKGKENLLADISISYDKNGQYMKMFDILKAEWMVSYGRYPGPGAMKEEECIIVSEATNGPQKGRRLVFVRKNGLFTVYSPEVAADPKF